MQNFIIRLVINALAVGVAAVILPGLSFAGEGTTAALNLLIVALIFGLVNAVIKPLLILATCPFFILTLGLFTFVVNALMLMLTSWLTGPRFVVANFWWALAGAVIISIVSTALSAMLKEHPHESHWEVRRR